MWSVHTVTLICRITPGDDQLNVWHTWHLHLQVLWAPGTVKTTHLHWLHLSATQIYLVFLIFKAHKVSFILYSNSEEIQTALLVNSILQAGNLPCLRQWHFLNHMHIPACKHKHRLCWRTLAFHRVLLIPLEACSHPKTSVSTTTSD